MKKIFLGLFFRVPIPFKTYQNTWYVMALGTYLHNFCGSKVLVLQTKICTLFENKSTHYQIQVNLLMDGDIFP